MYDATRKRLFFCLQQTILSAIQTLPYPRSGANHVGGMELLLTEIFRPDNGDRPSAPNIAIAVVASLADRRQDEIGPVSLALLGAGIEVLVVCINQHMAPPPEEIAAAISMGMPMYIVDTFQDLGSVMQEVLDDSCMEDGKVSRALSSVSHP